MAISLATIEQQAQALSVTERARLAEFLLESLVDTPQAEINAAWNQEIDARVEAYERGEVQTYPAEDVFAEARRIAR